MVGISKELLCCFCAFICSILAEQWTVYSYTPKNAVYPLFKLRYCQADAQDTEFCGARLVNGTACELLTMDACEAISNGLGDDLHMRKTTVRREHTFLFETLTTSPRRRGVHEYIPVYFQPGSQIKVAFTPPNAWSSIHVLLYNASTPISACEEFEYNIRLKSDNTGQVLNRGQTLSSSTGIPLITNEAAEIRISCEAESLQIYVNGTMFMHPSHVIPPQSIGQLRFVSTGITDVIVHSIQYEAANKPDDSY